MSRKSGLFLFEAIVYILLLITLISITFMVFLQFYNNMHKAQSLVDAHIYAMTACDLLARDLQMAASGRAYWKKIGRDELIWHSASFDTGWRKHKNRLERLRGIYDQKSDKWKKISLAPMLNSIEQLSFAVKFYKNNNHDYEVSLVTFKIKLLNSPVSITRSVTPRNRNL